MNFKFWTIVGGKKIVLHTENLFEAKRMTRAIGGLQCMGLNPTTQKLFVIECPR